VRLEPEARRLTFRDLLPNVPHRSAMDRAFRAWVSERASEALPEHRRIDPRRVRLACPNRAGNLPVALALELAVMAKEVADGVPRGYRSLADQLIRSGPAVALLIAEGANRAPGAQKRQRYVEARGECGEAAATLEVLARLGLVDRATESRFAGVADRVAAMLSRLILRIA